MGAKWTYFWCSRGAFLGSRTPLVWQLFFSQIFTKLSFTNVCFARKQTVSMESVKPARFHCTTSICERQTTIGSTANNLLRRVLWRHSNCSFLVHDLAAATTDRPVAVRKWEVRCRFVLVDFSTTFIAVLQCYRRSLIVRDAPVFCIKTHRRAIDRWKVNNLRKIRKQTIYESVLQKIASHAIEDQLSKEIWRFR